MLFVMVETVDVLFWQHFMVRVQKIEASDAKAELKNGQMNRQSQSNLLIHNSPNYPHSAT